jgi:SAM-dependent methyltransferase
MKPLDRLLQRWRIAKAAPFVPRGARVLDVGCADGALFELNPWLEDSIGIDPGINNSSHRGRYSLIRGRFPDDVPADRPFDAITMLAVLEHVTEPDRAPLVEGCAKLLVPGGTLILTVPSPVVDKILEWLKACRLIDGMDLEQHHHFDVRLTPRIFAEGGFELEQWNRFQLGLNNLFVFRKLPRSTA